MSIKIRVRDGKVCLIIDYRKEKGVYRRKFKTIGPEGEEGIWEKAREKAEKLQLAWDYLGSPAPEKNHFGTAARGATVTFKLFSKRWLKEQELSGLKESTLGRYKTDLNQHLIPAFGELDLRQITYLTIKSFVVTKQNELSVRTGRKYARNSIRLMLAALRAVMAEALNEQLIPANPVSRSLHRYYKTAPTLRESVEPFTEKELERVERCYWEKKPDYYEFVLMLARAGLRFGEARALQWEDIDFEEGKAHVHRNLPAYRGMTTPKSRNSVRRVDLSPDMADALRRMLGRRTEYCFSKGIEMPDWVFVNPCNVHGTVQYSHFLDYWNSSLKKAKVRGRNPHQLRHTFASLLLSKGENILYVAAQLGDNPQTVWGTYAHWIPDPDGARGVDRLDRKKEKTG